MSKKIKPDTEGPIVGKTTPADAGEQSTGAIAKESTSKEVTVKGASAEKGSVPEKAETKTVTDKHSAKTESKTENKTTIRATAKKPPYDKTGESKKAGKGRKKAYAMLLTFTFFIAISAAGLAAYDFWLWRAQAPLTAQLSETQSALGGRIDDVQGQLQSLQTTLNAETQARKNAEAEHQALNTAMQAITDKLGRTTVAWRLAEVEYLLTVANHRLTLAQDRDTAIAVFETADQRLRAIGDPALLKVRKIIADEVTALRSLPEPDITGMALRLGSLAENVEQLSLIDPQRIITATGTEAEQSPANWRDWPQAVWNDLKGLVQVRRHQQPVEPLLPPEQAWFLRENLRLKLEQARLALLRRDTALFRQTLAEAKHWIDNFFDAQTSAVAGTLDIFTELAGVELQPAMPDVSGSLRALRKGQAQWQQAPAGAGPS